jgi:DNA invertase Pin-like site-specific DNA recombinase
MMYGYARLTTDGQSVDAQVAALTAAGAAKVFCQPADTPGRSELRRAIAALEQGDFLLVTRLDRLARSSRDLVNALAKIADRRADFRSLGDGWADTTTEDGRLIFAFPPRACQVLKCMTIRVRLDQARRRATAATRPDIERGCR